MGKRDININIDPRDSTYAFDDKGKVVKTSFTIGRSGGIDNQKSTDSWYQRAWRPTMAIIYMLVILFDFIIMPVYVEYTNAGIDHATIEVIRQFEDPMVQTEAMRKLNLGDRVWKPLSLEGGGLIHLALGAILTGAAVTRGMEKKERARNDGSRNEDFF